jgi:hypothetical protein
VDPLDEVRRGEDCVAALLGLDAGVGGPAVDGDLRVEDAFPRRDDVAVRPGALQDKAGVGVGGQLADVGRRRQRADLSSGFATNVRPSRQRSCCRHGAHGVEAREEPGLHVGHAGAVRAAVGVDPKRALGGGARVEDRVHVADEDHARSTGGAAQRADDRRPEAARGVGPGLDLGADVGQEPGDEPADLVDALGRRCRSRWTSRARSAR